MVQEVQTGIGVYNETTLETIEAIGTSSFKIVEGRQTKGGHYASNVVVDGKSEWLYDSSTGERDSGMVESTDMSITSSSGKITFSIKDLGIRVPTAGTYRFTLYRWGGSSTYQPTIYVIRGTNSNDEILYTKSFGGNSNETVSFDVDLGKFEVITMRGSFHYSGSSTYAGTQAVYTLTLQQL